jgi:glutathione S-transferase
VYGIAASGNCHKVKMALEYLKLPYRWHEVDVRAGETRSAQFLDMNPNGEVPVLQIDGETYLAQSDAILCFLADGTALWPGDRLARAQALQWMFFEQYSHEPCIAVARSIRTYQNRPDDPPDPRLPDLMVRGQRALAVMERHLSRQPFFVERRLTIADLALFAYTHCADQGGFDLANYPAVRAWIGRCLEQPGVSIMPAA